MSPVIACTFRSCRPVAEGNAPTRTHPRCVRAHPRTQPYGTKRELLFLRKRFRIERPCFVWFVIAAVRTRRRCHDLFLGEVSPRFCAPVRLTRTFPVDCVKAGTI